VRPCPRPSSPHRSSWRPRSSSLRRPSPRAALLLALVAALVLPGCAAQFVREHFASEATLTSGHDVPGDGDQLVFTVFGVEGCEDGGVGVVLPDDWRARPTVRDGEGWRLVTPLAWELVPGDRLSPPATRATRGLMEDTRSVGEAPPVLLELTPEQAALPPTELAREREQLAKALENDRNAYGWVATRDGPRFGFEILALDASGPRWIRLGEIEFVSSRQGGVYRTAYWATIVPAGVFDFAAVITLYFGIFLL